jgi:hypothetical protein
MDKKSDKVNESDLDVSRFAREEENARRRLLDEKDKQMSMASWDIDNYLKQTISPHPNSLFEERKSIVLEPQSE